MDVTTLTSKSQITLPKDVRRALGLAPKDKFLVMVQGGVTVLIPLRQRPLTSYFGALSVQDPHPIGRKSGDNGISTWPSAWWRNKHEAGLHGCQRHPALSHRSAS